MNIAKFCIRHKVTTLLAVIMIAMFGSSAIWSWVV